MEKENVKESDILEVEVSIGIRLSDENRNKVLREYNRICMDRGDDWETLIRELIIKENE